MPEISFRFVSLRQGWFDSYDWVIRVNPDVIIYDERPLLALMRQPRTEGVFANCGGSEMACTDAAHTRGCDGTTHVTPQRAPNPDLTRGPPACMRCMRCLL